jgi:hypothetical protein
MIEQGREVEAMLAGHEPPSPPPELRNRVLDRAGAALDRPAMGDRWIRIYTSRPLRIAWVATLICLLTAHVFLPTPNRRSHRDWFLMEAAWRAPELKQAVEIPRLRGEYASLDAFANPQPGGRVPTQAAPRRKEKN